MTGPLVTDIRAAAKRAAAAAAAVRDKALADATAIRAERQTDTVQSGQSMPATDSGA